ncbi:MAG: hypothetical protein V1886_02245 [archaeon]
MGIRFQELDSELEAEINGIKKRIQSLRERVKERIVQLNSELEQEIRVLRQIDLKERKESERVKFIVLENLKVYISRLQNLMDNLKNLDLNDREYFIKIHALFENFKKNSINSFQKATILIGREIEEVISSIRKFSADVEKIMAEDKGIFERERTGEMLKNLLISFKEEKKMGKEIKTSLLDLERSLDEVKKRKNELEKNLEDVKKSSEYLKFLDDKEERKQEREKAESEIMGIKQEMDIKAMMKHFHHDRKKSMLLREYAGDFNAALENDKNLRIIEIVKEFKPEADTKKLEELRLKRIELKSWQETAIERKVRETEEGIKKLNLEFKAGLERMSEEKKRMERIERKSGQIKEEIGKQARVLWKNLDIAD